MADNLTILKVGYEAFAKGDIPTVLGLFDPTIEWNEAEHGTYWTGGAFHGPQEIVNGVFARIHNDFGDFRFEIGRMVAAVDTVLVEARCRGTGKATGKPLNAQVAHVWDFRDGKIIKWQEYTDTWQFAQVSGITPKR